MSSKRLSDSELACAEVELLRKEGARHDLKAECRRARSSEERKEKLLRDVLAKMDVYRVGGPEMYWSIRKEIDS